MVKSRPFEFVFMDVGNVLVSDDPAAAFLYRKLYEYTGGEKRWTPQQFFAARLEHVKNGGDLWSFIRSQVKAEEFDAWRQKTRSELFTSWEKYSPPIPGMGEVVQKLARFYRLGLIANQPTQIREVLTHRGLWHFFEVTAISEELGVGKPDPAIFLWAIERAKVDPKNALMIGDRIDNDIVPARRLGMSTLWLSLSFEQRGWVPQDEFENAYAESVKQRCVSSVAPGSPEEKPDFEARSPQEVLDILCPGIEEELTPQTSAYES